MTQYEYPSILHVIERQKYNTDKFVLSYKRTVQTRPAAWAVQGAGHNARPVKLSVVANINTISPHVFTSPPSPSHVLYTTAPL
jgi:hypothetical protein